MPVVARPAPPGRMVDSREKLTPALLRRLRDHGFSGVVRYLPLPGHHSGRDVDAAEVDAVLGAGLGLLLVQNVRRPHWDPRENSGVDDGIAAAQLARAAGYLPGAHIFLHLEGIVPGTSAALRAFAEGWASVVVDAGFQAGCYVRFDVPLSWLELFDLRFFNSYGSDLAPRRVAVRGFAMKQERPVVIDGHKIDPVTIQLDEKGETPHWMISDASNGADDPDSSASTTR
jgi:Domain of unknown function (DUF1906)